MPETRLKELARRVAELEHENMMLSQFATKMRGLERYLLEIVDNIPAPIYLKDSDGRYLLINKRYEELAHITIKDIIGKTDFDIFPEQIATLFRTQDEEVIKNGAPLEFEETITLPDKNFTFITSKFPLHDKTGKIHAVGGFCTDISERIKVEEEKSDLINKLQMALDDVKTLRGIIPICSFCKKVRDDKGYWTQVETYVSKHTEAGFSHGFCPECLKKNFPDYAP